MSQTTVIENRDWEEIKAYEEALGRPGHFRWDMTHKQHRKHKAQWAWWSNLMEELCQVNPCPYCYAEAGTPCPNRKEGGSHYGRRQLAGFRPYDGTNLMVRDGRAYRWERVPDTHPNVVQHQNGFTIEIKKGDEVLTTLVINSSAP